MAKIRWINRSRISTENTGELKVDGMSLTIHLSPYDIPTAISGKYDKRQGLFEISFRYIDDEPAVVSKVKEAEGFTFYEGKHSGKLLKISIPIDETHLKDIAIIELEPKLKKALSSRRQGFRKKMPSVNQQMNQDIAEEIINQELKEIASDLVPA